MPTFTLGIVIVAHYLIIHFLGVLYIRYNHDTTYYTFEYEGDIEINISIKDNVRYTNLLNIIEIKNNLLNDWDSIKQHISHKTEKRSKTSLFLVFSVNKYIVP